MSDFNFDWQPMDFPTAPSPRTAGQRSRPIFSAQHMQMQPVAPRVRVSNSQLAGSNTAWMNRTPAQNRGLGANTVFAPPFETAANNRNGYHLGLQTAFPMQRNPSIHSESSMPSQDLPWASADHHHSNERLSVGPLAQVNEHAVYRNSLDIGVNPGIYLSSAGANMCLEDMSFNDMPSAPPSMVSTSSAAEDPWPMTRQNSGVQVSPNMQRMPSISSFKEEPQFSQGAYNLVQASNSWKGSNLNNDLFAIGNGIASSFGQQGPLESLYPSSASMERETSNMSIKSTKSTASNLERRAKEATERVIQNSRTTAIAPMPLQLPQDTATSIAPRKKHTHQEGDKSKPKPKMCAYCDEYPNGFRGDHELRRHTKAKHTRTVKKYVCRHPTEPTPLRALYPLSKCKACASGKLYGAYYNAAAHLRRTHFTPKPTRARGGASMGRRTGGRGGGDWPPMKDLRLWFVEVTVEVDESASPGTAHESPDKRSPSLPIEEEAFLPATQMNDPVGLLDDNNSFEDMFDPDMSSNNFIIDGFEDSDLSMIMSGLNDHDIDIVYPSQDSTLASNLQDAEDYSIWQMSE